MYKSPFIWATILIASLLSKPLFSQDYFELDLKAGYANSIVANWPDVQGLGSNLNLGYQKDKNSFGLNVAYYRQYFNIGQDQETTQHYAFGLYYARAIVSKSKFSMRIGASLGLGGANTYYYMEYFDYWHQVTYEGKFAPRLFINGYYLLTNNLGLSYELNTHLFSLSSTTQPSGAIIFNALVGITFLLPTN